MAAAGSGGGTGQYVYSLLNVPGDPQNDSCVPISATYGSALLGWLGTYSLSDPTNPARVVTFSGLITAAHTYATVWVSPEASYKDDQCTILSNDQTTPPPNVVVTGTATGGPDAQGVSVACNYTSGTILRVGAMWVVTLQGNCTLSGSGTPLLQPITEVRQGTVTGCLFGHPPATPTPVPDGKPPRSCLSVGDTFIAS